MRRNTVAWAALAVATAALVGSRASIQPLPASQDIPPDGQKVARELSAAFHSVAEFVAPSVVQINIEKTVELGRNEDEDEADGANPGENPFQNVDPDQMEEMLRRFFGRVPEGFQRPAPDARGGRRFRVQPQQYTASGTGSGVVYDDQGHILTNAHVVSGADEIVVTFDDGSKAKAEVVGTLAEADIAVIQVEPTDHRPAKLGASKGLQVGEWVLAVGSPFGLSQSVTAGIVSATQREDVNINDFESFIQTDASINPGNSGGPLVDLDGRVVGINTAIATASRSQTNAGVGFAIPIDMAKRVADRLIRDGEVKPILLGIGVEPLTRVLAGQLGIEPGTEGVVIVNVVPDSPAERAGLKLGDVITRYDGNPVHSLKNLQYLVFTSDVGQDYPVDYLRSGEQARVMVGPAAAETVAGALARPSRSRGDQPEAREEEPPAEIATNAVGLAVEALDDDARSEYGWDGQDGLVVTAVDPEGPAAAAGIEVGDLITRYVRDRKVQAAGSPEEFAQVVEDSEEVAVYLEDVNHRLPGEFKVLTKP